MTIEPYNYNDEPSGRTDTLIQALEKIERLEKQLKIAVEALEFYEKPFACFHPDYNIAQHHKKAAEALVKIKELENKNKIFTYMGKPVDALTYIEKKIEYERKELGK